VLIGIGGFVGVGARKETGRRQYSRPTGSCRQKRKTPEPPSLWKLRPFSILHLRAHTHSSFSIS